MRHKVLITTSGIGSRLGDVTSFTNKSLVSIGNKPVISHIIESYPKDTNFVITIGYFGTYVKQFLELAYPDKKIEYVKVDNYSGPGSSLGYSLLQAKEYLQCPFIYHATDTILPGFKVEFSDNFCVGCHKEDSSQYATLITKNNIINKIKPKGELNFDYPYVGVSGIKDFELFWRELEDIYNKDPNNSNLSDVHVINNMLRDVYFKFIEAEQWFDTGNTTELFKTNSYFKTDLSVLDKKDESVFIFDKFVIKFFTDSVINKNRALRGQQLNGVVPNLLGYTDNFYKYVKAEGNTLARTVNEPLFNSLLQWSLENLWTIDREKDIKDICFNFYFNKTKKRVNDYLKGEPDKEQLINGIKVPPVTELLELIDIDWLCNGLASTFHGDFILDNIIEKDGKFSLIDWRQDFGGNLDAGDIYYDLAKLNHNLTVNHDIVHNKQFNHLPQDCFILCNSTLIRCKKILKEFILKNNLDYKKVDILTSLIWINMAPLHSYPFRDFLFNFGKLNLYNSLK